MRFGDDHVVLSSEKDDLIQLIGFYVEQKLFGADILTVREILRAPAIEPVESGPAFIEGIVNLRGEIIPIIDLGRCLGQSRSSSKPRKLWILIARAGGLATGYFVDAITGILKISLDTILPAPDLILAGLRSQYIRGVCNTGKGLLVVLDLARILGHDEINALKKLKID